jgi:hypothetical protein
VVRKQKIQISPHPISRILPWETRSQRRREFLRIYFSEMEVGMLLLGKRKTMEGIV